MSSPWLRGWRLRLRGGAEPQSGGKTEGRVVFAEISSERAFFCLPALNVLGIPPFHAEVVELVDTLGSGSSEGSFMGVRVSPSHHKKASGLTEQSVGPFFCILRKFSSGRMARRSLLGRGYCSRRARDVQRIGFDWKVSYSYLDKRILLQA